MARTRPSASNRSVVMLPLGSVRVSSWEVCGSAVAVKVLPAASVTLCGNWPVASVRVTLSCPSESRVVRTVAPLSV